MSEPMKKDDPLTRTAEEWWERWMRGREYAPIGEYIANKVVPGVVAAAREGYVLRDVLDAVRHELRTAERERDEARRLGERSAKLMADSLDTAQRLRESQLAAAKRLVEALRAYSTYWPVASGDAVVIRFRTRKDAKAFEDAIIACNLEPRDTTTTRWPEPRDGEWWLPLVGEAPRQFVRVTPADAAALVRLAAQHTEGR